jgi:ABC-type methionine transport system permease subunit
MASAPEDDRDRYAEATLDLSNHIGDKLMTMLHTPENQARLQSLLDPVISHIINRVFPYILLSAILFLILFILTIGTFWMVMRTSAGSSAASMLLASTTS